MYLLVFKHPDNDLILSTSQDNQIRAFNNITEVMDAFKGFNEGWTSSQTWAGATIAMMNVQPIAFEYNEPAESIAQFLIAENIVKVRPFGMTSFSGVHVKKEILDGRKTIQIWKESMIRGGIYDPHQSDLVGKQTEMDL